MYFNSYSNIIHGGTVEGSLVKGGTLSSLTGNLIYLEGYLAIRDKNNQVATLGWEPSGIPGADNSLGIGMSCSSCEVKATEKNAGLKCGGNYISTESSAIIINAGTSSSVLHLKGAGSTNL